MIRAVIYDKTNAPAFILYADANDLNFYWSWRELPPNISDSTANLPNIVELPRHPLLRDDAP